VVLSLSAVQAQVPAADQGPSSPNLTCPSEREGVPLGHWVVVQGDPWGPVILAPSSSQREGQGFTNTWNLGDYASQPLALRCAYGTTNQSHIIVALPPGTMRCVAHGPIGRDGGVMIPMTVSCR
jgi:hypothetical protein